MIRFSTRRVVLLLAGAFALVSVQSALALQPDEIALVVNSNVPDGVALAQFYAQQRHIPDNRILVLDLPKADQMSCRQYEDQVVPQVRDFIHSAGLEGKLKCLVSFYGVPLRIDPRVNTAEEDAELIEIRREILALVDPIRVSIEATEGMAKQLDPAFVPDSSDDLDHLFQRRVNAFREISSQLETVQDKKQQIALAAHLFDLAEPLIGDKAKIEKLRLKLAAHPTTAPADHQSLAKAEQAYNDLVNEAGSLETSPDDAQARARLRQIARANFGSLQLIHLLRDQADYLDASNTGTYNTGAAFDNELAMVEWTAYPHKSFAANPLHYSSNVRGQWQTLMVTRLDAPQVETVRSMITTSIRVEKQGLTGQLVIDTRGLKPGQDDREHPGFGAFDGYLHDLGELARQHTKLKVLLDDKPEVLPAGSAEDVALYCGWYSVHNYIPSCKFNPGAVGFHIASYELLSLRNPGETGWVHGLLNDGVVGTLGPVAEPFLGTFPRPDDFFPLLMTGKLTLAEVYWKTEPAVSWMMDCVGDPLYTPYKTNPPLAVADLPSRLKGLIPSEKNALLSVTPGDRPAGPTLK
jgi:uncharacterized protein (TIGR03790 family)